MRQLLPVITLALLAGGAAAQQILVGRLQALTSSSSSTTLFRTASAGRFQVAYDSTLFTDAGVTGPITINRLRFRRLDGRRNPGGQAYAAAILEVGNCAVDHAALSATFLTNRGTMGLPAAVPLLTFGAAEGTHPNDYVIDVDLAALSATFSYDPTTGNDLLIDITMPTPPVPTTNNEGIACSSSVATHRANAVSTATPLSLTGTVTAIAPVCLINFSGPGGYTSVVAARTESYGAGCADQASSFYQFWPVSESFDLRGNPSFSLRLIPDSAAAPTFYNVTAGTTAPDVSPTALGTGTPNTSDDATVAHTPGFTFNFPGGSTTAFGACTNGYVWLSNNTSASLTATVSAFLGTGAFGPRMCPALHDWQCGRNTATHAGSGMYVNTDLSGGPGNGVTYVTWKEIGEFNTIALGGVSVNTFQCAIFENGNVEFRYGAMNGDRFGSTVTGFSRGQIATVNAVDPGSRDLSIEVPFRTHPEGTQPALGHGVTARPALGTSISFTGFNHPATALVSGIVISFGTQRPGVSMAPLNPGCLISLNLSGSVTYQLFFSPTGTVTSTPLAMPGLIGSSWMGVQFATQYAVLNSPGTVDSSNALLHTIGLQ